LEAITTQARERAQEADLLRLGLSEIEQVDPQEDEDDRLRAESERLAHADGLRTAAETAHHTLSSDDVDPGQTDVLKLLALARQALDAERGHDAQVAALADRLAEAAYLVSDAAADLASYASGIDVDPGRLAEINDRRAALANLMRKYGDDISQVLSWSDQSAQRLLELDSDDERIESLRSEHTDLSAELADLAARLTSARTDAAKRLSDAISIELAALAMPHARVEVVIRPLDEPGPFGVDEIEMLFSGHAGGQLRPLNKGASGGELSRLMLAIEVVFAGTDPVPTFVFDEVDAGVGGKAAVEVGRRLAMLARHAQVIVVTHLPQVAAFADRHLKVVKTDDGRVTSSGVDALDGEGRVQELSRMLAGLEGSSSAQAHAVELLATASSAKNDRPRRDTGERG
jgi:DNA repair protein RecN (Recombination protein N)